MIPAPAAADPLYHGEPQKEKCGGGKSVSQGDQNVVDHSRDVATLDNKRSHHHAQDGHDDDGVGEDATQDPEGQSPPLLPVRRGRLKMALLVVPRSGH